MAFTMRCIKPTVTCLLLPVTSHTKFVALWPLVACFRCYFAERYMNAPIFIKRPAAILTWALGSTPALQPASMTVTT